MSIISNGFDYFGFHEIPTFVLCNPDKTPLHSLMGIKDRKLDLVLNGLSTLNFTAFPIIDEIEMEYYDLLKSKRLILIDDVGYFLITEVEEKNDGLTRYKTITANSLEAELIFKKVTLTGGTYKIYNTIPDPDNPDLLNQLVALVPNWSIGEVDIDLSNKYRNFDINDITVYNFLMNDVSESIEGIFVFDTFNRTINLYSVANAYTDTNIIKPSTIYLSHNNLMLETTIKDLTDELFTSMYVKGGANLGISRVNPLGTNMIYNFNHYKTIDWMSQELIDAINAWEALPNTIVDFPTPTVAEVNYEALGFTYDTCHQDLWNNYLDQMQILYGMDNDPDDTGLYGELDTLNQELNTLNITLANQIATGQSTTATKTLITAKENEISIKQGEIDDVNIEVDAIIDTFDKIANILSLENTSNFSIELQNELSSFIIETTYSNENFLQTDTMTDYKKLEQSKFLYDQAVAVLERISQPRYEFTIDSLNLIFIQEFANFGNQLQLGSSIYAEMYEGGQVHQPVLLKISLNYDDPQDFSMTFGNRLRLDSSEFIFADLFDKASSTGNTVSLNSPIWNSWNSIYKSDVDEFLNSALDAGRNNIITSANQEFMITGAGIRGRKLTNGTYDPEELWMNNNMLAFTTDNWNTASLVLGKIYTTLAGDTEPTYMGYGLAADVIVGKLLAGSSLIITNEGGSVTIDEYGLTVVDANFRVIREGGDPEGETISEIIVDTFGDVDLDNEIIGYFQTTEPTNSDAINVTGDPNAVLEIGDIWIDIDKTDPVDITCIYRYQLDQITNLPAWVASPGSAIGQSYVVAYNAERAVLTSGLLTFQYSITGIMGNELDWHNTYEVTDLYMRQKVGDDPWQGPYRISGGGLNGESSYLHIKYALDANGTGMTEDPTNCSYVGMYSDTNVNDSTNPLDYTWILIKGNDGEDGTSAIWKGEFADQAAFLTAFGFSSNSQVPDNWMYRNNYTKASYIYLSGVPQILSQDGLNGDTYPITWVGEYANENLVPTPYVLNQAYRNTTDGIVYIYDGVSWNIMIQDGLSADDGMRVYVVYHDQLPIELPTYPVGQTPTKPTDGTDGFDKGWIDIPTPSSYWMCQSQLCSSIESTIWGPVIALDGTTVFISTSQNPFPVPPYEIGDIWVQEDGKNTRICIQAQLSPANGGVFDFDDWVALIPDTITTFYQSSLIEGIPVSLRVRDQWFDTATGITYIAQIAGANEISDTEWKAFRDNLTVSLDDIFAIDGEGQATLSGTINLIEAHMPDDSNLIMENGLWITNKETILASTSAVWINDLGILLGQRTGSNVAWGSTGDGSSWQTAITASGIVATAIKTGTLSCADNSSWINLDNGTFSFGSGKLAWNGTKLSIEGTIDLGKSLQVDGSIIIGNNKIILSGSDGSITMAGSMSVTGDLNLSGASSITWGNYAPVGETGYTGSTGYVGSTGAPGAPGTPGSDAYVPEYIHETYIASTIIKAPIIKAGSFTATDGTGEPICVLQNTGLSLWGNVSPSESYPKIAFFLNDNSLGGTNYDSPCFRLGDTPGYMGYIEKYYQNSKHLLWIGNSLGNVGLKFELTNNNTGKIYYVTNGTSNEIGTGGTGGVAVFA